MADRRANIDDLADGRISNFRNSGNVEFLQMDTGHVFTRCPKFIDDKIIVNVGGAPWVLKITQPYLNLFI